MSAPLLLVTDGTTDVHLLGPKSIIRVKDWRPQRAARRTNWRTATLLDGRRPVSDNAENIVDNFTMQLQHADQNLLIEHVQNLEMLLTKAREYWFAPAQNDPVWIEARAPDETNTRYSIIVDYQAQDDAFPYGPPFFDPSEGAGYNEWKLTLEHCEWRDQPPGQQACVELGTKHLYPRVYDTVVEAVGESTDDAYVNTFGSVIQLATTSLQMGDAGGGASNLHAGLRFTTVPVPPNAIIVAAFLRFVAGTNQAGATCTVRIRGEDPSFGCATYGTYANFVGRTLKTAYVDWSPGAWVAGTAYDSADIAAIVQAIVDDSSWALNGDMCFQLRNQGSTAGAVREPAAWDHAAYNPPELHIVYAVPDELESGWDADCNIQMIANKHVDSQLSHLFYYDASAGTYSGNLLGTALPYAMLPAVVAAGDCIYFGVADGLPGAGPFDNLIFNLSVGGTYTTAVWEFQTAAFPAAPAFTAYSTFANCLDTTAELTNVGFGSVFFYPQVTWRRNTVNGIYGWWMRLRVTNAGAGGPPTQKTVDVYSAIWNYVDVPAETVPGTLPALQKLGVYNASGHTDNPQPDLYWNALGWFIAGLRSKARGENFRSMLLASTLHEPDNIAVTLGTATTELTGRATTVGGSLAWYVSAGVEAMLTRVRWSFNTLIAKEYKGLYHAFVRCAISPGGGAATGDMRMRLALESWPGFGTYWFGETVDCPLGRADFVDNVVDLGPLTLWPVDTNNTEAVGDAVLALQVECTVAAARGLAIMDIILIPADEWIGRVWCGPTGLESYAEGVLGAYVGALVIDSISVPTNPFRGQVATGLAMTDAIYPARLVMSTESILQARTDQRIHFLFGKDVSGEPYGPQMINFPYSWRVSRYHLMRGRA